MVIFCARAAHREYVNAVFSPKISLSSPCAIFDHNGPFRRLGAFPVGPGPDFVKLDFKIL
jgi:hypothetical protein